MKDIQLKIAKQDNTIQRYFIEDYCTSIKLSNSFSQIAAELSFTIPYATLSPSMLALNIEMGDNISLVYKEGQIFAGRVIDASLKGKEESLTVTAYDFCWWLVKSNITKNFNNICVYSALEEVYNSIGATFRIDGELGDNGNIMIKSHLVKQKPISKVLYAIYSEVSKATNGVYYYLHTTNDGATMTITEADRYYSGLTIAAPSSLDETDGNLIDYEISESMSNMITRVEFYNTTGEFQQDKTLSLDATNMARYGVIQEIVEIADDDENATLALAEGNKKISNQGKPSEELTVTCFGDILYKVAYGVMVKIPNTKYYDTFMYITTSEWTWNNDGTFISKLSLSPSKNQNLEDWASIEEAQENSDGTTTTAIAEGSTSSDLVNRIITELKSHLGLDYVWGGKSPADGGMDCSGYIAYVYNQFSSELEITSNDGKLTSYTVTMMGEGKDVTSDFPDNLKECDIIFPHEQHVVAYIGNGQIIEEPQTGDVCKIGDIRWDKVAKVIRVVPDSAWTTTTTSTSGTTDGLVSSNWVEYAKGWESFVSPAADDGYGTITIGYGTTGAANPSAIAQGTCTKEEATQWVKDEASNVATTIKNALDSAGVALPQNQFDCLVDIGYNNGTRDLIGGETWGAIINGSDKALITSKLMSWNHADGEVSDGLTKRCASRVKMFFNGEYDSDH